MLVHYAFRDAVPEDRPFLLEMLALAIGWRASATGDGRLSPPPSPPVPVGAYTLDGFGRPGDGGVVATRYGELAGACWWRLLPASAPGHGFVAGDVPELTIAVRPLHRRLGVGSELLRRALDGACADGFHAISLSVEADNPARAMYERHGFERVVKAGGSLTLRRLLARPDDA